MVPQVHRPHRPLTSALTSNHGLRRAAEAGAGFHRPDEGVRRFGTRPAARLLLKEGAGRRKPGARSGTWAGETFVTSAFTVDTMRKSGPFAGHQVPAAVTDVSLAVLAAASCLTLPEVIPPGGDTIRPPDHWWLVLMLVSSLPLAVHRRLPLVSLLVMAAASGTLQHLSYIPRLSGPDGTSIGPTYLAVAAAVFLTAVRRTPWRTTFVAAVFIPLSALTEAFIAPAGHRIAALVTDAVLLLAAWALGRLSRARTAVRDEAMQRAAALEREQAANARAAVMRERARIARELHDIVAHNVSLMVVQTIAADRIQDRSPDKAHELHATVEQTGRDTVNELRRLLGVLRTDEEAAEDAPSKEPPQPTIDALPSLVDAVRATGLDVDLQVSGTPAPLPAGYHLTVYRVVQEALTNTVKHAGATRTRVRLRWGEEPGRLHVRVCDDGPGGADGTAARPPVPAGGPGHGLLGMRERVAATGGTLHTGARPGGGYCVHAVLTLPEHDGARSDASVADNGGTAHHAAHQRPAGRRSADDPDRLPVHPGGGARHRGRG